MSKRISRKKRKRKTIIIVIIVGLVLGLFLYLAFGKNGLKFFSNDNQEAFVEEETPEPTPTPRPKLKIVDEDSNTRPFAVMIDNNVGNDKHAGLLDSFVTYEIIVEGGLSRIMAVFKDTDTKLIGPVRSSRHYFLDYALENGAIYAHYGWSTFAETDIRNLKVNNINGMTNGGNAYWRDKTIASPHNVFTSIENLKTQAEKLGYSLTGDQGLVFKYSPEPISIAEKEGATPANEIITKYQSRQTRSYTYDSTNEVYLRNMNGKPHIDKESKTQLSYKNVIVMQVENYTLDSEDHQDIRNIKSGNGYFLTNGYSVPINWTKSSRAGKTTYRYTDGSELILNDGRTFVQIVPLNQPVTINE